MMRRSTFLVPVLAAACASSQAPSGSQAPHVGQPAVAPAATGEAVGKVPPPAIDEDYPWLEDVTGDKALAFARAHNTVSEGQLTAAPGFNALRDKIFTIMTAKDRIPFVTQRGRWLYNFWVDAEHPRGLLRRTTWAEYKKEKPNWETVLDVDALGAKEHESWVFKGNQCLYPKYERCLVELSRGGGDAVVVRELDMVKKAFVDHGFVLPEAKSSVSWKDQDTIYVGTDFGAGTMTSSGYPRIVKEWARGTPLTAAKTVFEGKETDVAAWGSRQFDHGRTRDQFMRQIDTFRSEPFLRQADKLVKIECPEDAEAGIWDDQLLLRLRSDWTTGGKTYAKGSLLVTDLEGFLAGKRELQVLFQPRANASLDGWVGTKTRLVVSTLVDVRSEVMAYRREKGAWVPQRLEMPSPRALEVSPVDEHTSDEVWVIQNDFVVPTTLGVWNAATGKMQPVKQNPAYFDAAGLEVTQHFATSKDGTRVPYFEVGKKERKGPAPTLLMAYGGFEVSLTPFYSGTVGTAWLERGGVYVVANLRGGGEYGPSWHEAALKHHRQRAYDDMAAVAEDLVARKVTTPKQLGIQGGSNGGLLTSVLLTQRPELFGAVVSSVPLTDMKRYHKLLAGASWMGEYGNPDDPADWAALQKYSPFHNAKPASVVTYPPVLFTSSTRDDRVHPGHARKMVARLEALGHKPLYYENIEGGHGGAADPKQAAHLKALEFTFLAQTLGLEGAKAGDSR